MTRSRWVLGLLLGLVGCRRSLPEDQICREVAFAIAGRTQECTGDASLADRRYAAFFEDYSCQDVPTEPMGADTASLIAPQDRYACPLALRNLPCSLVAAYGDDLDAWLASSDMCLTLVAAPGLDP